MRRGKTSIVRSLLISHEVGSSSAATTLAAVFGIEKPITYALHVAMRPILVFTDLDLFGGPSTES